MALNHRRCTVYATDIFVLKEVFAIVLFKIIGLQHGPDLRLRVIGNQPCYEVFLVPANGQITLA